MPAFGDNKRRVQIESVSERIAKSADGTPEGFASALFSHAAPDDLALLSEQALALLAHNAWTHLCEHKSGQHNVRVYNPVFSEKTDPDITVVEIVNDDMPFLLDSTLNDLNERNVDLRLVVHPIITVERDATGKTVAFKGEANRADAEGTARASLIHIHLERVDSAEALEQIRAGVDLVLKDVRLATAGWKAICARVEEAIADFKNAPSPLPPEEVSEAVAFLQWLVENNFTFLGIREYAFIESAEGDRLDPIPETSLGILRDEKLQVLRRGTELVAMTPETRAFLLEPVPLIVTKASVRSRVHRRSHLDYIGIKQFDEAGKLTGELRLVGLFTSTAYTRTARSIPLLRRKISLVERKAGFDHGSHSGKELANILENHPRDDLFQIEPNVLYDISLEVLSLYERPRVRVLPRVDEFNRFVSVLVFLPRDKYTSDVRIRVGQYLAEVFHGRVSASHVGMPEGALARIHYIIGHDQGAIPEVDREVVEAEVAARVQTWDDRLKSVLLQHYNGPRARGLSTQYTKAFSVSYQDSFTADAAVADVAAMEALTAENPLFIHFYRRPRDTESRISLKILSLGRALPLSERVPVLENMGLRAINERTYRVDRQPAESHVVWLHDMTLERVSGGAIELDKVGGKLTALSSALSRVQAENDGYNALVLEANLDWRDVAMLRTLSRYLRQALIPFSQDYMWGVLAKHSAIASLVVELFHARFRPDDALSADSRGEKEADVLARIEEALGQVESLDEDRILRRFVNLVQSTVRTNFFQKQENGTPKDTISLKLESRKVEALPAPRPLYEIFVYSPRVEGVHLRFGKVARGGLRWSDRPQDFRTEVLGLVKAQQVKNSVIVPVGAKGGFVPKFLPAGPREAIFEEGTAAYKVFIGALLDITDTLNGEELVPPANVVRHDGDDPYLVVAADKGTATFSDTANGLAQEHGFWLDDAFASGGSVGYDHKKMGITARGAWEAVKRHFREMDIDIQTTPFSVAGVGDMSGDVFGNGMLLSPEIKLVAAFDHRDIFIDPDPDTKSSFAERLRLFNLARSSWQDYDKSLISTGGGVFPRSSKSIKLSAGIRQLLGLESASATPADVMSAILKMPVDLMWFGGIGTYIRAASETDEQVGDRANDAIRVTGAELNCKVVGEGANLGATQRGRIEFANRGGRINTDAIDNSAGVNSSDYEVNIKIGLSIPVKDGRLSREDRNDLLASMTDEVAELVLRNNYQQTLALSLAERRGLEDMGFEQRLMQSLEERELLKRSVEFLPDDATIAERIRTNHPFTRPELAVLLAYAKITLFDDLLASTVPDDPYLGKQLAHYFPHAMQEKFMDAIQSHRLRREIIATLLSNAMINHGGPSLVVRLADQTGADVPFIAAAFGVVRGVYRLHELNTLIDELDTRISGDLQLRLYAQLQDLLLSRIVWFLRNVDLGTGFEDIIKRFREGVNAIRDGLDEALSDAARQQREQQVSELMAQSVPQELASWMASLSALMGAPDVVLVAEQVSQPVSQVASTLFGVNDVLGLDRIRNAASQITLSDYYERLALDRAIDQIESAERAIAVRVSATGSGREAVEQWAASVPEVDRVQSTVHDIVASGLTLAKLTVVANMLADLVRKQS
jgi:glutamate dehydrogenase